MKIREINKNKKVVLGSVFALAVGLAALGALYISDKQSSNHITAQPSTAPTMPKVQSPQSFEDKGDNNANFTVHSTNTSKEEKQEREVQIANIIDESVFLFWEKKPASKRTNNENRMSDIPPMPPPPPPFNPTMPILTRGGSNDEDITPGAGRRSDTDTLIVYGYYCLGNDCVAYTNHGEIKNSGYIRGVGVIRVSQSGVKVE